MVLKRGCRSKLQKMSNLTDKILNWIYPPICIACKVGLPVNMGNFYICERCVPLFEQVPLPICKKCGQILNEEDENCSSCFGKSFHFESNMSTFLYDDLMRDLLRDMKFRNKKRIAIGLGLLWAKLIEMPDEEFTLTWLPMHPKKQKERGFNQAELMASEIAKEFKVPCKNLLRRTIDTPAQSGLHPKLRQENVKDAFEINSEAFVLGACIVIIDDIYTTGASINECAKVLIEGGANKIYARTLALTPKKINSKENQ